MELSNLFRTVIWMAVCIISFAFWLWPSSFLDRAFFQFVKSPTAEIWGGGNIWPLIPSALWSISLCLLLSEKFTLGIKKNVLFVISMCMVSVGFPAVSAMLMFNEIIPISRQLGIFISLIIFFAEIPIAALVIKDYLGAKLHGGIMLMSLKVTSFTFATLTAAKLAAIAILPGIYINFSWR